MAPDFFARRKRTHRAGAGDGSRWKNHLAPHLAHRPTEVDAGRIRAFIEAKLAEGVNPATIASRSPSFRRSSRTSPSAASRQRTRHATCRTRSCALGKLGLARPGLGWYQATRHTFASQRVMAGGSIEKLKEILGHYSVIVTERYAHLRPDLFPASDLATIALDMSREPRDPAPTAPTREQNGIHASDPALHIRNYRGKTGAAL